MSDFKINDYILAKECEELAKEIFDEIMAGAAEDETAEDKRDEMTDRAHEAAGGHQWAIYTYRALKLCAECNTENGEQFLEDTGMPGDPTFHGLASIIAYGEIRARVEEELSTLIDEWTDERESA